MAYNVVKGKVGSIVGKDNDQEVGGKKTFINPVSAHGFYDVKKQSEVATLDDVALTQIKGDRYGGVLTFTGGTVAAVDETLRFDGQSLHVPNINAQQLTGSGAGLYKLPSNKFINPVPAHQIAHSHGLRNIDEALQVKPALGIEATEDGVGVKLSHKGGLSFDGDKVVIDVRRTPGVKEKGQNLHDADLLLVQDSSRGDVRSTTLANLYNAYINTKVPHAEGGKYNVQFRGNTGFAASPNFRFEPANNILAVNGQVNTNTLFVLGSARIEGTTQLNGAMVANIITVKDEEYAVQENDYTILADTSDNNMRITLPAAANHKGRVINIKKINANTYRLNSNKLTLVTKGGKLDSFDEMVLKMNNSSRALQSDGQTWWNIGTRGS